MAATDKAPRRRPPRSQPAWLLAAVAALYCIGSGALCLSQSNNGRAPPVAFLKTHKTGSTTMASILFRHAARHGLALPNVGIVVDGVEGIVAGAVQRRQRAAATRPGYGRSYDVLAAHLTPMGGRFSFHHRTGLDATVSFYRAVLHGVPPGDATATAGAVELFTLVRHPAKRLRSHFDYYLRSTHRFRGGFDKWVDTLQRRHDTKRKVGGNFANLANYECEEIGLYDAAAVDGFLREYTAATNTSPFGLLMVVERLDVCLVLLRRRLIRLGWDWELRDLVHLDQTMSYNWKGRRVTKSTMTDDTHAKVCSANPLDMKLWSSALKHIDVLVEREKALDGDGGRKFEGEMRAYAGMQAALKAKCAGTRGLGHVSDHTFEKNPTRWAGIRSRVSADVCLWYMLDDSTYSNYVRETKGNVSAAFTRGLAAQVLALRAP